MARSAEDAIQVIANGRNNMLAFGHSYSAQQLRDLTRFVTERLAQAESTRPELRQ